MALTALDPKAALIVVDLQRGLEPLPMAHPFAAVVGVAADLADAFRSRGLAVVLVNTDGRAPGRREQDAARALRTPGGAELAPELRARPEDHRVTKQTPGAFTNTGLGDWLKARAITQVVIAGVATGTGVEATARQAYELGFNVALAVDAMTDMDAEVHANSVRRIFPRLGETGTSAQIAALLPAAPD